MARRFALLLAATVAALSACGTGAGGQYMDDINVKRPNGGSVECVSQEHGLDCDWANATR